jgi:hypothetical protein
MAKGMKISKVAAGAQVDQATSPITFTYASSTATTATVYRGGTGGVTAGTTSLVIKVNYKDSAGNAYTDGQIIKQKGRNIFNVQSVSGGVATLSRVVLTAVAPGSLTASQASIKGVGPTGNLFYAGRISDRYVWTGTNGSGTRYPYVLGTTAAVTYDDTTSTSGVVLVGSGGISYDDVYALVEGC